jgi:hypothetical protein
MTPGVLVSDEQVVPSGYVRSEFEAWIAGSRFALAMTATKNHLWETWQASRAADKARIAELESALGTLTKAVKELRTATPLLHCELFHHKRLDQHSSDAECPPFERWCVAAMAVTAALAEQGKEGG